MTAATIVITDNATAAAVGSPPGLVNGRGRSRSIVFGAETAGTTGRARAGVPAMRAACGVTVEDLICQRAELPAGHPDRAVLRARSIEAGLPLARCLAAKYQGRGEPLDDLYQVAALALVKAVDGYDPGRQTAFTSYAVPTIVGALKRHFRDTTWRIRMPRRIQELAITLVPVSAGLTQQLGRSPTLRELAAQLDAAEEDVAIAVNAWHAHQPESLDAPWATGEDERRPLVDTIGAVDERFEAVTDRHVLQQLLAALPARQQRILAMRFYAEMTQAEIAVQVGVSQMQISRLLVLTLTQLRIAMVAAPPPRSTRQTPDVPAVRA
jgi:RNA polymerase sigma-B factor